MYRISERLAKVKNKAQDAFGSISMIFAGDFAQLPPIGGETVSLYTHTAGKIATTLRGNYAAIGKALWHQVTHVVILRKNMRNQGESNEDKKFRKALENMRYKACTTDDIRFLNTLVSSPKTGRHYIGARPWRDAPIIVGENKQKDEINRLGCIRFASDTKQQLTDFYSDDCITSKSDSNKLEKTSFKRSKSSKINSISRDLQDILWDLPPSAHEYHAPAVLSICRGMPVIVRHNVATELNVTKGQRGIVYTWHASTGKFGQPVLDVLFVLLTDPPNPVQIEGLPLNVVPLTRRKSSGYLYLPDDSKIYTSRFQVDVLPGFALTAHASQGQSLEPNATDLNTFNDHHAYYTALSRSRSAKNTIILQGFDSKHITGGASGSLRK
ncbi:uncharacterized protein C8R40DRAFT_1057559, partial [Lentinula edodes]|uniref:uncharacterized protein n=1 Tax=Lentinula edodes TaxID=5353 RepID=UPI001E8DD197